MKRFIIITMLIALCGVCHAQDALFQKYEDVDGVTTVYISKAMFRMMPHVNAGNRDISKIASRLDRLQILNCERPSLIPGIKKMAVEIYKRGNYEYIMRVNDDGDHTTIYQKQHAGGKNEFVLLSDEKDELSIINVLGAVTLNEIKGIAGN
jgi:hypothetical protein